MPSLTYGTDSVVLPAPTVLTPTFGRFVADLEQARHTRLSTSSLSLCLPMMRRCFCQAEALEASGGQSVTEYGSQEDEQGCYDILVATFDGTYRHHETPASSPSRIGLFRPRRNHDTFHNGRTTSPSGHCDSWSSMGR